MPMLSDYMSRNWELFLHTFLIPSAILGVVSLLLFGLQLWRSPTASRRLLDLIHPEHVRGTATAKMDLVLFFLHYLVVKPLAVATTVITASAVSLLIVHLWGPPVIDVRPTWAIVALQLSASFFFVSLGIWVGHYSQHKVPFLWHLHKVHHTAESLNPTTTVRVHPIEQLIINPIFFFALPAIPTGGILYITGGEFHPTTLLVLTVYILFVHVVALGHHTHLPIHFGWFSRIVTSPVMHQIHHSVEPQHRDKNFGLVAIYDWMFGTLYIPERDEPCRIGVNLDEMGENNPHLTYRGIFIQPAIDFARGLFAAFNPFRLLRRINRAAETSTNSAT